MLNTADITEYTIKPYGYNHAKLIYVDHKNHVYKCLIFYKCEDIVQIDKFNDIKDLPVKSTVLINKDLYDFLMELK